MRPTINDLEILARQAGDILLAGFSTQHQISLKGEIDIVTETDLKAEEFLIGEIRSRFPEDGIVAEESGGKPENGGNIWYLDPIDGTTNFAHGLPIFCVSIGFASEEGMELAAVYNPAQDEMFTAQRGRGAWLNGDKLAVSTAAELAQSVIVTGFPYDRFTNPNNNLTYFNAFAVRVRGIRRLGAAALDLCYVAAGRLDGYWEIRLEAWDLAAGMLVAQEAGAKVTNMQGIEIDLSMPPYSVIAANPGLHGKMADLIRETNPA